MNDNTRQVIDELAPLSFEGRIPFGELLQRFAAAGVESYFADFRLSGTTYYAKDGDAHALGMHVPDVAIPESLDAAALQGAIRGSQRGEVQYPEFKRRAMAAGCVGYHVWIAGRHVAYYGRLGEVHVEHFPDT
jgi:uncharacterized protein YbcV (DUF1398 family)